MKSAYVLFHATHVGSVLTGGVRQVARICGEQSGNNACQQVARMGQIVQWNCFSPLHILAVETVD